MTTVATKKDVVDRLSDVEGRLRSLGVQRLGLFGSFVREEQVPASDVDVLVEFQPGKKSFDNFMRIAFLLEEVLERSVGLVAGEGRVVAMAYGGSDTQSISVPIESIRNRFPTAFH